ncbi:MAG: cyclic nucleotide-binding domain-containing protein [Elusimicrobia bacterium]|nr:cyclic nucleotide-binding domain-containing protein [Elusimicrobiota bacterium]
MQDADSGKDDLPGGAKALAFDDANLKWLGSVLGLYAAIRMEAQELITRLPSIRLLSYPEKADIIREGERKDDLYILYKGKADVLRNGKTIAELVPGDFFGEIGFLVSIPRTATVRAGNNCEAFRIKSAGFEEFVKGYPSLLEAIRAAAKRRMSKLF